MENPRGYDQSACSLYEPKPMHLNLTEFKFLTMVVNDGGVTQACNCRQILEAIAKLIEAQRDDLVLANARSGTSPTISILPE